MCSGTRQRTLHPSPRLFDKFKDQQTLVGVRNEGFDAGVAVSEQQTNRIGPRVADREPNHLRWRTTQEASLPKIVVLGDDGESLKPSVFPDDTVGLTVEVGLIDMPATRKQGLQVFGKARAEVLVKE
jgi:hypothetical protein